MTSSGQQIAGCMASAMQSVVTKFSAGRLCPLNRHGAIPILTFRIIHAAFCTVVYMLLRRRMMAPSLTESLSASTPEHQSFAVAPDSCCCLYAAQPRFASPRVPFRASDATDANGFIAKKLDDSQVRLELVHKLLPDLVHERRRVQVLIRRHLQGDGDTVRSRSPVIALAAPTICCLTSDASPKCMCFGQGV